MQLTQTRPMNKLLCSGPRKITTLFVRDLPLWRLFLDFHIYDSTTVPSEQSQYHNKLKRNETIRKTWQKTWRKHQKNILITSLYNNAVIQYSSVGGGYFYFRHSSGGVILNASVFRKLWYVLHTVRIGNKHLTCVHWNVRNCTSRMELRREKMTSLRNPILETYYQRFLDNKILMLIKHLYIINRVLEVERKTFRVFKTNQNCYSVLWFWAGGWYTFERAAQIW